MTDLFEKCLKNAEPVQQKMDTNMMTIRNLDAQYQIKEQEAKQKLAALVNSWKKLSKEDQRRQYNAVLACFAEAKKLCDQKIDTASETYEMVDGFIQKLDCDTAKFTTFVQQKHANAGPVAGTSSSSRNKISAVELEPGSTSRKRRGTTSSASTSTLAVSSHKRTPQKRGHDQTGTSVDEKESEEQLALAIVPAHGDMPVDPNEPRYCICQQVSFGNMVCCDNKNCSLEWFHFPCVDLTAPPKGKWFCPQCRESKEPKKTPRQRTTGKSIGKEASKD